MKRHIALLLLAAALCALLCAPCLAVGSAMDEDDLRTLLNSATLCPQKTGYEELDAVLDELLAPYRGEDAYTQIKAAYDIAVYEINFDWSPYSQDWAPAYDCFAVEHTLTYDETAQQAIPWETANRTYHALVEHAGICYDYAAAFAVMARYIGINAYVHTGYFTFEAGYGDGAGHHGWAELELDGVFYIFDPQRDYRLSGDATLENGYYYFGIPNENAWRYSPETEVNDARDAQFLSVTATLEAPVSSNPLSELVVSHAGAGSTVEAEMTKLIEAYGLTAENFSLSYYNLSTKDNYSVNAEQFFPSGTLWLLPLHMYFYEMETLGKLEPEDPFEEEYLIDGMNLAECRYRSILLGNDEVAQKMLLQIGDFEQYQLLMNSSYGHCDEASLPKKYFFDTYYSADFLMNCLIAEENSPELYGDLKQNFSAIQTDDGIAAPIAAYNYLHIAATQDAMHCEILIVSAPRPYLLVCYYADSVDAQAIEAISRIFLSDSERVADAAASTAVERTSDTDLTVMLPQQNHSVLLYILIASVMIALIVIAAMILLHRKKHNGVEAAAGEYGAESIVAENTTVSFAVEAAEADSESVRSDERNDPAGENTSEKEPVEP